MSNNTNLAKLARVIGTGTNSQVLTSQGGSAFSFQDASGGSGTGVTVHTNQAAMLTDAASADEGSLHYENNLNKLFVKAASGFFLIATISNLAPTIDTFTETTGSGSANTITDNGTFPLTAGSNTVITLGASDANLDTLSFSATVVSGTASNVVSSPSLPVTNQAGNTFTLTPSTSVGGTITIRFDVTDGTNVTNKTHSFIIGFAIQNSRYNSLLMSANAAGTNSTFTDSNTQATAKTITASGDTNQGSFSPYRLGGYSTDFGGNGYLTVTNPTAIGSGDFTIDFFYRPRDASGGWQVIASTAYSAAGSFRIYKYTGTRNFTLYFGSTVVFHATGNNFTNNEWAYAAFVRSGSASNNVKCYVNGILQGIGSSTVTLDNAAMTIGAGAGGALDYKGEIRDFRISQAALYTTASTTTGTDVFSTTLPTSTLQNVSSTILRTCNLPYFSDTSASPRTITSTGDAKTAPSGPYDYAEASVTDGGGVNFDGSGDYLSVASHADLGFGTGDFTLECFVLANNLAVGDERYVCDSVTNLFNIHIADGRLRYRNSTTGSGSALFTTGFGTITTGGFHHLAISRQSGTTRLFRNGTQTASASDAHNYAQAALKIGSYGNGGYAWQGIISDFRIVKGTSVYTSNFAPPTSPLEAVTNTKLLVSGQGAKIFDKSQVGNIGLNSAVGVQATSSSTPAQINSGDFANTYITDCSSATKYVTAPSNGGLDGAFTIETYLYITQSLNVSYAGIIGSNPNAGGAGYMAIVGNGTSIDFYCGAGTGAEPIWTSLTIPQNSWFHFAIQRSATNLFSLYINGTKQTSGNNQAKGITAKAGTVLGGNLNDLYYITRWHSDGYSLSAYLQDFRITDGLERYTSNFTPHTAPLKG